MFTATVGYQQPWSPAMWGCSTGQLDSRRVSDRGGRGGRGGEREKARARAPKKDVGLR